MTTGYTPPGPMPDGSWNGGEGDVPKPDEAVDHEILMRHIVRAFHVGASSEVDWQCTSMLTPARSCRACKADPHWGEEYANDPGFNTGAAE